ncbi:MAG: hypothetical protein V4531_01645 [Actinomycetota bacterium]
MGDSENTKSLIRGVGFWRGQKSFQSETAKIPQFVLDPNGYGNLSVHFTWSNWNEIRDHVYEGLVCHLLADEPRNGPPNFPESSDGVGVRWAAGLHESGRELLRPRPNLREMQHDFAGGSADAPGDTDQLAAEGVAELSAQIGAAQYRG